MSGVPASAVASELECIEQGLLNTTDVAELAALEERRDELRRQQRALQNADRLVAEQQAEERKAAQERRDEERRRKLKALRLELVKAQGAVVIADRDSGLAHRHLAEVRGQFRQLGADAPTAASVESWGWQLREKAKDGWPLPTDEQIVAHLEAGKVPV